MGALLLDLYAVRGASMAALERERERRSGPTNRQRRAQGCFVGKYEEGNCVYKKRRREKGRKEGSLGPCPRHSTSSQYKDTSSVPGIRALGIRIRIPVFPEYPPKPHVLHTLVCAETHGHLSCCRLGRLDRGSNPACRPRQIGKEK